VIERGQTLIQRFSAGDAESTDIPAIGLAEQVDASPPAALGSSRCAKDVALLSCGGIVRVVRKDKARRAIISFVDDGKVDVMYPPWGSRKTDEEEEGIPAKTVQPLLDFEAAGGGAAALASAGEMPFKVGSAAKEEGNQLMKLRDYEAAHERYTLGIRAFAGKRLNRGDQVLGRGVSSDDKPILQVATVTSIDAGGQCELDSGIEVEVSEVLPVFQELLPLQTALHMNRARSRQALGLHKEAAEDLTVVLLLWSAANPRMLEADPEMKEAEAKGLYTAEYLRGRSRLALGFLKQASADVKASLARNPPAATVKQLRELKAEVQAAQEKYKQTNGPLTREIAKVNIALRGGASMI
jgi:hypothetical protein